MQDTAIDQIKYVGAAKAVGTAAYHAYNSRPVQALLEVAKVPKFSNAFVDGLLNHAAPYAETFDNEIYPRIKKGVSKALGNPNLKADGRKAMASAQATYKFQKGGAVILGGQSHEDEGPLGKGNPIVLNGEKVAETESEELLLSKPQTDRVLKHVKKFRRNSSPKALVALGKEMKQILETETIDNRG